MKLSQLKFRRQEGLLTSPVRGGAGCREQQLTLLFMKDESQPRAREGSRCYL